MRWVEAAGGVPQAMAQFRPRSASHRTRPLSRLRRRFFGGSLIASIGMGRGRRRAAPAIQERQGPGRALSTRWPAQRHRAARHLSRYFLHQHARQAAGAIATKAHLGRPSRLCQRLQRRARPRLGAAAAQARRRGARPQRRAVHHRARGDRALPRREGPPRPARLRRSDRQDARAAQYRNGRLGALQARWRHRPSADRRGAGHQPQAMADRQGADRRVLRRRRRARPRPHPVRGR